MSRSLLQQCGDAATLVFLEWRHTGRGESGEWLDKTIRERLARRPMLIGISGEYKHSVDRILSEVVGFDHYLVKPYEPAALMALLEPLRYPQAET